MRKRGLSGGKSDTMEGMTGSGRAMRGQKIGLSLLIGLVLVGLILLLPGRPEAVPYAFEGGEGIDVEQAEAAFRASGENADLYKLLLGLCRQASLSDSGAFDARLRLYGDELYARAKRGALDLETVGDPSETTPMLELLRTVGAAP